MWMLLLQAVIQTREALRQLREIIIHRHFETLLLRLDLAQQFQLIAADQFGSSRWRRRT